MARPTHQVLRLASYATRPTPRVARLPTPPTRPPRRVPCGPYARRGPRAGTRSLGAGVLHRGCELARALHDDASHLARSMPMMMAREMEATWARRGRALQPAYHDVGTRDAGDAVRHESVTGDGGRGRGATRPGGGQQRPGTLSHTRRVLGDYHTYV